MPSTRKHLSGNCKAAEREFIAKAFGSVGIPLIGEASFAVSLADGRLFASLLVTAPAAAPTPVTSLADAGPLAALPAAPTGVADTRCGFHPRKRKALVTTHTELTLEVRGDVCSFTYPLVGRFNVANVMTAFGIGLQLGFSTDDMRIRNSFDIAHEKDLEF